MLDDKVVTVDLFNTGLTSHGAADASLCRRVFDEYEELAVTEIDPILDRYQDLYIDLSRRRH